MQNTLTHLSGIPIGFEPFAISQISKEHSQILYLVRDEVRLHFLREVLSFVSPELEILSFPAWDTVPYDRVAPAADTEGVRIETLSRLAAQDKPTRLQVILAPVAAVMQKVPVRTFFAGRLLCLKEGESVPFDALKSFLVSNGYKHTNTVMETGEYAVRGGLIDLFPAGFSAPVRIDFFGDEIDSIKYFDPITQLSRTRVQSVVLKPVHEFVLDEKSVSLFRSRYRELFGVGREDALYAAVSEGRYVQGVEHFLPLLHEKMETLFDYVPQAFICSDFQLTDSIKARYEQIMEYYQARHFALTEPIGASAPYYPIEPSLFFLSPDEMSAILQTKNGVCLSPFVEAQTVDMGGRGGYDFTAERLKNAQDVIPALADVILKSDKKIIISAATFGSGERITGLLREKHIMLQTAQT
ncbi:MAG: transcription-repair coupling factor, partial [Alphaproteobacteria bacterium]